jgi:hypothetical protein
MFFTLASVPVIWPTRRIKGISHLHSALFIIFLRTFTSLFMICRSICERRYSKIVVGESCYSVGKKYCRRCEIYLYHTGILCPCCGMRLRTTPIDLKDKAKIRGRWTVNNNDSDNDTMLRRLYLSFHVLNGLYNDIQKLPYH